MLKVPPPIKHYININSSTRRVPDGEGVVRSKHDSTNPSSGDQGNQKLTNRLEMIKSSAIQFFMAMEPPTITHQQHKVTVIKGKPVFYEPFELKAARAKLTAHLGQYVPKDKLNGPLQLLVKWCFPLAGDHVHGEYKATKPDTDNLNKLLKDCMTDVGYWQDDAQVASEIIEKFYSNQPGIYIKVVEL